MVGGGPGGLKAAAVAAERGHRVTLVEAARRLGGQVLLAQEIPGRAEFGGAITNLQREAERAGVKLLMSTRADVDLIGGLDPDAVVLATGALPRVPELELIDPPPCSRPGRCCRVPMFLAAASSSPTGAATGSAWASPSRSHSEEGV